MNTALKKYPQIFKNYFSKIYPYKNDYFGSENMLDINDGIFILKLDNQTMNVNFKKDNIVHENIILNIFE